LPFRQRPPRIRNPDLGHIDRLAGREVARSLRGCRSCNGVELNFELTGIKQPSDESRPWRNELRAAAQPARDVGLDLFSRETTNL